MNDIIDKLEASKEQFKFTVMPSSMGRGVRWYSSYKGINSFGDTFSEVAEKALLLANETPSACDLCKAPTQRGDFMVNRMCENCVTTLESGIPTFLDELSRTSAQLQRTARLVK